MAEQLVKNSSHGRFQISGVLHQRQVALEGVRVIQLNPTLLDTTLVFVKSSCWMLLEELKCHRKWLGPTFLLFSGSSKNKNVSLV